MDAIELWADGQRAMSELGRALGDDEGETVTPACPAWTVRQVFAHQSGVAADLLAGNLNGVATDEWTGRQVDERTGRSLTEILDEWDGNAPRLVEALAPLGDALDRRLLVDLWNHEQDVRGAVARPVPVNELGRRIIDALRANLAERLDEAGLPALTIDIGDGNGSGSTASVRVPDFEYLRAAVGRRSRDQIEAWDWQADDVAAYVDQIPVFSPRQAPLEEPRP